MSFPAYEDRQETGMPSLGDVPSHWELKRLKDVASHNDDALADDTPEEADLLYVDISSVNTQQGIHTKEEVGFKNAPSRARRRVQHGDVIVSTVRTYLKAIARVIEPEENLIVSTGFAVIRPGEQLDPGYAGFLLLSTYFIDEVISRSTGVSYPAINASDLVRIHVPLPPLDEQQAIASFLDVETSKIDGLVSEQRRLIELLKEKRQAVISHAVTKGLNPNAPMKPSGIQWLGDVPVHWEVRRIKHAITSIEQGWSPQCENDPVESENQWGVLKVGCVNYGKFTAEENKALPPTLKPQPALGIQKDDLLISRANTIELVGSAAVAERDHKNLMLCDKLYRFRMDDSHVLPEFLCYFLTCEVAREQIELGATGASPSMKNIAQSVILELWFAAPDIVEQNGIINAIRARWNSITRLIAEAERGIELLQERRTALISAAVTGKIDVREFATRRQSDEARL